MVAAAGGAGCGRGPISLVVVRFDHVAQQVPDIAAALEWWSGVVPGARVLYADETWGLLEAGGAKLAFVMADEHPTTSRSKSPARNSSGWRAPTACR